MEKEQEAIKNLTDLLKQRYEKEVQITTYDLFGNIETVLSMLKEKDRQINSKNGTINALQCALKERTEERDKYIKHSEEITTEMNEDINKLLIEIKEKDKQIDELVKYIDSNNYVDNEECQFQWDFKIEKCAGNGDCKDCIKQYFEKLAKEKGE